MQFEVGHVCTSAAGVKERKSDMRGSGSKNILEASGGSRNVISRGHCRFQRSTLKSSPAKLASIMVKIITATYGVSAKGEMPSLSPQQSKEGFIVLNFSQVKCK